MFYKVGAIYYKNVHTKSYINVALVNVQDWFLYNDFRSFVLDENVNNASKSQHL